MVLLWVKRLVVLLSILVLAGCATGGTGEMITLEPPGEGIYKTLDVELFQGYPAVRLGDGYVIQICSDGNAILVKEELRWTDGLLEKIAGEPWWVDEESREYQEVNLRYYNLIP